MKPVEDVLASMNIEHSQYQRVDARAPWGISFHPRDAAYLMLIASGSCWLTTGNADGPQYLEAGACFLMQAGHDFVLQHDPDDDVESCASIITDVVVEHGGDGELTEILFGRFPFDSDAAEPLLTRLPPLVRLELDGPSNGTLRATFDLIAQETATRGIGSGLITSRLADVLFIQALRACCASFGDGTVSWIAALRDPELAPALQAMHADLARPWTIDTLAREANMSRSAFAAAFKARTGETPLAYLTSWRMYRTKTLLRDTSLSLHEIARRVGYDSGTALSRAFSRREGTSPGAWRRRHHNRQL
ncbi:AraC family transcriptional regulator [Amycolatopsis sp. NEAU-NG30]|uniref:AraC family transcriptional regulator n=1 Tax=Amycolatopsis melonis TaxID=3156488 RepID=A0ABV0LPK5_9PSEU